MKFEPEPRGSQASRLRPRKLELLRRFRIPDDLLAGSWSRSPLRGGKPTGHGAPGEGHPVGSFTFMVQGKKRVPPIPKDWGEEVQRRVEAGREVRAANAQRLVLARPPRKKSQRG